MWHLDHLIKFSSISSQTQPTRTMSVNKRDHGFMFFKAINQEHNWTYKLFRLEWTCLLVGIQTNRKFETKWTSKPSNNSYFHLFFQKYGVQYTVPGSNKSPDHFSAGICMYSSQGRSIWAFYSVLRTLLLYWHLNRVTSFEKILLAHVFTRRKSPNWVFM